MALFQRKPHSNTVAPLYSLGQHKSLLIVGLGNSGKEYTETRHNIGFKAIDQLAQSLDMPAFVLKKDLKSEISLHTVSSSRIIAIKPNTMMNLSGQALAAVMHFYKVPLSDVIVVHDELDIPFGQIRTRKGGSSAGNNGIKSIIESVGEDFGRVRIGIHNTDNEKMDSADFVLANFSKAEREELPKLLKETTAILTEYAYGGQLLAETRSFL